MSSKIHELIFLWSFQSVMVLRQHTFSTIYNSINPEKLSFCFWHITCCFSKFHFLSITLCCAFYFPSHSCILSYVFCCSVVSVCLPCMFLSHYLFHWMNCRLSGHFFLPGILSCPQLPLVLQTLKFDLKLLLWLLSCPPLRIHFLYANTLPFLCLFRFQWCSFLTLFLKWPV